VGQGTGTDLVSEEIEHAFPRLKLSGYSITSPSSPDYNCIAWAASDSERWWEPDPFGLYYWPEEAPLRVTLEAFIAAFETRGYQPCENSHIEFGFEKVAVYVDAEGRPTHAARQLPNGLWTSKLGKSQDIEHELEGVTGSVYGSVAQFLKRPINE
jgi:hypothetical protein